METLGERISRLMKLNGVNQKKLAKNAGVSEAAISRYINNERIPRSEVLANMATALNTTSNYLLYGSDEKKDFNEVYSLVARGLNDMSEEEKMILMRLLVNATKQ